MALELQEYLKFRVEVGRELLNVEVDTNFRVVANPWVNNRVYQVGYIIYTEVEDIITGETRLGWFRANTTTTKGIFIPAEWDEIGGGGGGGAGNIAVKDEDVLITSSADILNFKGDAQASNSGVIAGEVDIFVGNQRVIPVGEVYTVKEYFSKTVGSFVNLGETYVEPGTNIAPGVNSQAYITSLSSIINYGTIYNSGVVEIIS
jgi:hypothetical protein